MTSGSNRPDPGLPRHVGIVMDGNGRWAKARGKARLFGHHRGAEVARSVVEWAIDAGVRQLYLYAFSTENWDRPKGEVRGLMSLLSLMIQRTLPEMMDEGVRLRVLGDISALPGSARRSLEKACATTENNDRIDVVLCLNYGGQQEIVAAVKQTLREALHQDNPQAAVEQLDATTLRANMWRHDLEPVDLLIRTGGEMRISNFHLWDAAYAELYFTDVYWPDFSRQELQAALDDFARRERRFGKTSEQVTA